MVIYLYLLIAFMFISNKPNLLLNRQGSHQLDMSSIPGRFLHRPTLLLTSKTGWDSWPRKNQAALNRSEQIQANRQGMSNFLRLGRAHNYILRTARATLHSGMSDFLRSHSKLNSHDRHHFATFPASDNSWLIKSIINNARINNVFYVN